MTHLSEGKLYIKKRTFPQYLTSFVFLMPFFIATLTELVGLPSIVKYSIDVAWVILAVVLICRKSLFLRREMLPIIILVAVFFIYCLIDYLLHFQSIFYFLWGVRNNFRFFIAFFAFATFFDTDDAKVNLKFLDVLFWINAVVTAVQFFALGYNQDYLGGIFGVVRGCNAYTIIFFCIVVGKSVLAFMDKQENMFICFAKCGISLIIGAMAELKIYFLLFVIILFVSLFLTSFSYRKLLIVLISVVFLFFGNNLLVAIFGTSSQITLSRIFELATQQNYATAEDLNRLSALPTISNTILRSIPEKLFGLGLGNCDTSTFALCNTPFFESHADLHYTWISSAFMFLETGYIGFTIYLGFFVICCVYAIISLKKNTENKLFSQLAIITSIVCFIVIFYNSSMRAEIAYVAYFVLALPFIARSNSQLN
ncbi:MAG: hypothetical protein IJC86_00400 [Clostridia bacterium]|nr:hypothetical protein [Clostridia bacterium]